MEVFAQLFNDAFWGKLLTFLIVFLPIALPLMLFYVFWVIRFRWITMKFAGSQKPCLLEIRLPKEIVKSPEAMEIFFSYLSQGGDPTYTGLYLDGKTRPWFSCELVSIGGNVRFFIWASQARFKSMIEAQLYAQYPNIEVHEVSLDEDYTKLVPYDLSKYTIFGLQYQLTKADPYPIKTYIEYHLEKNDKEEYKIDPMTAVLEYLGSLRQGEYAWIQILLQKHEKEGWKHGVLARDAKDLKGEIKKAIDEIKENAMLKKKPDEGEEKTKSSYLDLSKRQGEIIAALERSASKPPFDAMIRSFYIAENTVFNGANIGGLIGSLRQYSSSDLNGFKPGILPDVSPIYKDIARFLPFLKGGIKKISEEIRFDLFHAYRLRSFFQHPYKYYGNKPFVLTTEELATLFHFPSGMVSQTPTLKRVESKKSEAPANLPI